MRVSRPLREFDDLYKALRSRRYRCRLDPIYGPAALRVEGGAPIAAAMLLVFDAALPERYRGALQRIR